MEEQIYRFMACLIQKAMEELSLVEDYMGEGVQQQGGGFGRARDEVCGLSSCPDAEEVQGGRASGRGEVHRKDWVEGQEGQVG